MENIIIMHLENYKTMMMKPIQIFL